MTPEDNRSGVGALWARLLNLVSLAPMLWIVAVRWGDLPLFADRSSQALDAGGDIAGLAQSAQ